MSKKGIKIPIDKEELTLIMQTFFRSDDAKLMDLGSKILNRYNGAIHQEEVEERHKVEERLKKDEDTIPIDVAAGFLLKIKNCKCRFVNDNDCINCFKEKLKEYLKEIGND